MAAHDIENSAAMLVNSMWCSIGPVPIGIDACTVESTDEQGSTQGSMRRKKGWKGAMLRALGSKSKRRLGAEDDASASAPPRPSSSNRFLPSMLSSIGSSTGRRSARGQASMMRSGSHGMFNAMAATGTAAMFNTTGTDIMETAQSEWAFNTVGAPSSVGAASSVTNDQQQQEKPKKRGWWRSLGRTR